MQIPEKVKEILDKLEENGYEAYAVGGCVRDSLLGRVPGDWDITTSAKPNEVKDIFPRTVDTGIQHGTVTVLWKGDGFEVTTYRVDGEYRDSRHPEKVEFTPNLEEDLKRRDFTINAMAYNPSSGIVDLFDGEQDLQRRCIRCVGNPRERFMEDALRMLRGIRFAGQLGFEIEKGTKQAMTEMSGRIANVSAERIREELSKLFVSQEPGKLLEAQETGLCQAILPEFIQMLRTEQNTPHHCYNVGVHALHTVENVRKCAAKTAKQGAPLSPYQGSISRERVDLILAYAALFHDIAKPLCKTTDREGNDHFYGHDRKGSEMAHDIMRRLRFDNESTQIVTQLIYFHERRYDGRKKSLRRLVSKVGKARMPFLFVLQEADVLSQSEYLREEKLEKIALARQMFVEIIEHGDAVHVKDLAVNGKDLIAAGVIPGPEVGRILQELLETVISDPQKNNSKELLTEVKKRIRIESN